MTARGAVLVLGIVIAIAGAMTRVTEAQPPRLIKIGALTASWGPTPAIVGFRDGLQELGYRENQHFVMGVRFTKGNLAELSEAAQGLVRLGTDLIVATEDNATKAAQTATTRIPIVFVGGSDPVRTGLVQSLARPGGNITGIADLEIDLVPKRLEIFRELVPRMKRVLLVYDATNAVAVSRLEMTREGARRAGVVLVERPVRTEGEARSVIGAIRKGEVDGIYAPRQLSFNIPGLILQTASKQAIPTMFEDAFFVENGGLASYAASLYESGRQAARLADKIFKGARPEDIPVEQPTKFELAINRKAAHALGITIPQSIWVRVDRFLE